MKGLVRSYRKGEKVKYLKFEIRLASGKKGNGMMRKVLHCLVNSLCYCTWMWMCLLSRDLLDAPVHSRNTAFPKSNIKYKHNLPCKVRVSSSRHLSAREGRSDVVLHLRHRGIQEGEDTFPPEGNVSKGKSVPIWLLQAEALLACGEQQEIMLVL